MEEIFVKKNFTKLLSIFLSVVLLSLVAVPAALAIENEEETVPLICVIGFAAVPLYENYGTEDELQLFPPSNDSLNLAMNSLLDTLSTQTTDVIISNINNLLSPIACNPDGTSANPLVDAATFPESLANYDDVNVRYNYARAYGSLTGEQIGWENVYIFSYDWRRDLVEVSDELNDFVEYVKQDRDVSKVNMVASSMGAIVATAYLANYEMAEESLNNLVFLSPAFQGVSILGDLFTGHFEISAASLTAFVRQFVSDNAFMNFAIQFISEMYIPGQSSLQNNFFLIQLKEAFYEQTVKPIFGNMAGVWAIVPTENYDEAIEFMFPDGVDPILGEKLDRINNIQVNLGDTIESAMDAGVKVSIVSNYGKQILPIGPSGIYQSDMIIDTKYTSAGATTAIIGSTLGNDYVQAVDTGNNHISPDRLIDASTCLFPENTWFIKNLTHTAYEIEEDPAQFIMWLLAADEQLTVWSDEAYPQFMSYDAETGELTEVEEIVDDAFSAIRNFFKAIIDFFKNLFESLFSFA